MVGNAIWTTPLMMVGNTAANISNTMDSIKYIYTTSGGIYFLYVGYNSGVYFKNLPSSTTAPLLQALVSNIFSVFFVLLPRPNSNRVNESTNLPTSSWLNALCSVRRYSVIAESSLSGIRITITINFLASWCLGFLFYIKTPFIVHSPHPVDPYVQHPSPPS